MTIRVLQVVTGILVLVCSPLLYQSYVSRSPGNAATTAVLGRVESQGRKPTSKSYPQPTDRYANKLFKVETLLGASEKFILRSEVVVTNQAEDITHGSIEAKYSMEVVESNSPESVLVQINYNCSCDNQTPQFGFEGFSARTPAEQLLSIRTAISQTLAKLKYRGKEDSVDDRPPYSIMAVHESYNSPDLNGTQLEAQALRLFLQALSSLESP